MRKIKFFSVPLLQTITFHQLCCLG